MKLSWQHLILLFSLFFISNAALAETGSRIHFSGLWAGFSSESELADFQKLTHPSRKDLGRAAAYYFLQGSDKQKDAGQRQQYLSESIRILTRLWKTDRRDNRTIIRLAYARMAICDTGIPIDRIMDNVSKAKAYFDTVVGRLPENLEARLGRILININLPAAMQPDEMLLEDAESYLGSFQKLPVPEQQDAFLQMGRAAALLSQATVWEKRKNLVLARKAFQAIDTAKLGILAGHYQKLAEKGL